MAVGLGIFWNSGPDSSSSYQFQFETILNADSFTGQGKKKVCMVLI